MSRLFKVDILEDGLEVLEESVKFGKFSDKVFSWLKPQVIEFIKNSKCSIAYDPFVGDGSVLAATRYVGIENLIGLSQVENETWQVNDSLVKIPKVDGAIILTNPPYLAKNSATRKDIDMSIYFDESPYQDLYLIALDKMVRVQKYIVAIIPESFISSNFKFKNLLHSITILEENPFTNTETPVCVVCFDGITKDYKDIKIYKNEKLETTLEMAETLRYEPNNNVKIEFNDPNGWLAIRAIDSTNDVDFIKFGFKEEIEYDWDKIGPDSRLFTLLSLNVSDELKQQFIDKCNETLNDIREKSVDTILTAFKGNTKKGVRRRRLDFKLARAIVERVYYDVIGPVRGNRLFNIKALK